MAKKEMNPQAAMFQLRAMEGFLSLAFRKSEAEGKDTGITSIFMNDMHEAIDMACTALTLMGDSSIEIEEGGSNDRGGKTDSGDN